MEMSGITGEAWSGESAIRAIEAGADIILLPIDVERTLESILRLCKMEEYLKKELIIPVEKNYAIKT